jgi:hypothetical protein
MPKKRKDGIAMPRETIHYGNYYIVDGPNRTWIAQTDENAANPEYADLPRTLTPVLDVVWQRDFDGSVQIGLDLKRRYWIDTAKDIENEPLVNSRTVYTESLSRAEINHFIKTLRRARDAAFGSDE